MGVEPASAMLVAVLSNGAEARKLSGMISGDLAIQIGVLRGQEGCEGVVGRGSENWAKWWLQVLEKAEKQWLAKPK